MVALAADVLVVTGSVSHLAVVVDPTQLADGPRQSVRVEVELDEHDHVRGEVVDQGTEGVPAIRRADHDPGSLGLAVVDELTTAWGVRHGSTHVWFELGHR